MKLEGNVFFTSDTHYNHKNICRGVSEWKGENKNKRTRDFDTLDEMNAVLVNNINERVGPDDTLFHLGDWSFGGFRSIWAFRHRLACRNIHLIYGNHDEHIIKNTVFDNVPARDLFSSTQYVKTIYVQKQQIFLSHYSHQVWDKSHKDVIHLFGHSHGTLEGIGKSIDVGVDTNNLKPYSFEEVMKIMSKKKIAEVDHHISTD